MSTPLNPGQTWVAEYQARFGTVPGSAEPGAELERCVQICQELLRERDSLRVQLVRTQQERDEYRKALGACMAKDFPRLDVDYEELRAQVVQQPTLPDLIAGLM